MGISLYRLRFVDRLGTPGWVLMTGLLLGLSFPPFPFFGLAWVALVPMLSRWSQRPHPRVLFLEAYASFLVVVTLGGFWVLFHADALQALLAGGGLLLIPLPYAAAVVYSSVLSRRFGLAMGGVALVTGWLMVEFVLSRTVISAPWLLLGHSQANALPFNQFADLTGVGGLSLWVWALNGGAFLLLRSRRVTAAFALSLALALLVLSPVSYRGWHASKADSDSGTVRIAVAQPALPVHKWAEVASTVRVQQLADLSDEALAGTYTPIGIGEADRLDLIIWPEAALPVFPDARLQNILYARLSEWTERRGVPLLTGAITRYDTAPALTVEPVEARQAAARYPYYNSAVLFDGHRPKQQYDKVIRMPLGDPSPRVGLEFGQVFGVARTYGVGGKRTIFVSREARFATLIGYEMWFGDHTRRMTADGAMYLVALSNTGWWGYSPIIAQTEAVARLRAIETRRAVVSASVTGGSGVILPDGTRADTAGWMEKRVVSISVPIRQGITPYVQFGDVVYLLALGVSLMLAFGWVITLGFLRKD